MVLDAAAYVPTNPLDVSAVDADFVCVSFYKMFGYPTGLGALIGGYRISGGSTARLLERRIGIPPTPARVAGNVIATGIWGLGIRALAGSFPTIGDPSSRMRPSGRAGDPPTPGALPDGCPFHPRCDRAGAGCTTEDVRLIEVGPGRLAACLHAEVDHG